MESFRPIESAINTYIVKLSIRREPLIADEYTIYRSIGKSSMNLAVYRGTDLSLVSKLPESLVEPAKIGQIIITKRAVKELHVSGHNPSVLEPENVRS